MLIPKRQAAELEDAAIASPRRKLSHTNLMKKAPVGASRLQSYGLHVRDEQHDGDGR
jgi:hypothetical protein